MGISKHIYVLISILSQKLTLACQKNIYTFNRNSIQL